jgi:hypothetical protein
MIMFVRKLTALPIYGITFACEGLSFDYNWNSKIGFCVQIVEIGVMKMSYADIFHYLVITFHMGTSEFNSTAVILSRV